jgi:hypothetical protein
MLNQASVKPSGQNRGFFYFHDYFETEENVMDFIEKAKNGRWCFTIGLFRDGKLIRRSFFGESKQEASDKAVKALP